MNKTDKKIKQIEKERQLSYSKVGRAITLRGAIEKKSNISFLLKIKKFKEIGINEILLFFYWISIKYLFVVNVMHF